MSTGSNEKKTPLGGSLSSGQDNQDLVQLIGSPPQQRSPSERSLISAGLSRVTYCSDPPLFPPDMEELGENSDAETAEVVLAIQEQRALMAEKDKDIELLELTREQLAEMLDPKNGLTEDEYFDLKYLAGEASRCWTDRMMENPQTHSPSPRLFPKSSASPMHSVLAEDPNVGPVGGQEFEKKHPIMFRNIQRNRARRKLFEDTLLQPMPTGSVSGTTSLAKDSTAGSTSVEPTAASALSSAADVSQGLSILRSRIMAAPPIHQPTSWSPQKGKTLSAPQPLASRKAALAEEKKKMAALRWDTYLKSPEAEGGQPKDEESSTSKEAEEGKEEKDGTEAAPAKAPTLAELLKEQRELIDRAQKNDAEVYRPLLASFERYEKQAQDRLEYLASDGSLLTYSAPPPDERERTAPPSPDATKDSLPGEAEQSQP